MITPITATFPALNFPKESDYPTQNDWAAFSAAAELNYGILSGEWSDKSEEFKEQTNNLALEIQAIGENAINVITFDNIAQLKLNSNMNRVDVLGYYTKGDSGGGAFYWDSGSTESDNGGTIIQATGVTTGRWKRIFNGLVDPKWFGAKGGSTVATASTDYDDTQHINEAYNYCKVANKALGLFAFYKITSSITVDRTPIIGFSKRQCGFIKYGDFEGIIITDERFNGEYFTIFGTGNGDTKSGIYCASDSGAKRYTLRNVASYGHGLYGFELYSGNLALLDSCEAYNNVSDGFRVGGVDGNAITVINADSRLNGGNGFNNIGCYNITVIGGYAADNTLYGWVAGNNSGTYLGIGGEINGSGSLLVPAGVINNYIKLAIDYQYTDLSSVDDANTIISARDSSIAYLKSLTVRRLADNTGGVGFDSHTSSGIIQIYKDDSTRNLNVQMVGTSSTGHIDMSGMGVGKGLILRDTTNGKKYLIRVTNGVVNTVDLGV